MRRTIVCAFALALAVGCTKKATNIDILDDQPPPPAPTEEPAPKPALTPTDDVDFAEAVWEPDPVRTVVYFDLDSDRLRPTAQDEIERMANTACGKPIRLTGGACPLGESDYNMALGLRRGYIVKKFLMQYCGAEGGNIAVESVGETNLAATNPEQYHQNRRCEIELLP